MAFSPSWRPNPRDPANIQDRHRRTRSGNRHWKLAGDCAPESRKPPLRLRADRGTRRPRDAGGKHRENTAARCGAGAAPLQELTPFPAATSGGLNTHDICECRPDDRMLTLSPPKMTAK